MMDTRGSGAGGDHEIEPATYSGRESLRLRYLRPKNGDLKAEDPA